MLITVEHSGYVALRVVRVDEPSTQKLIYFSFSQPRWCKVDIKSVAAIANRRNIAKYMSIDLRDNNGVPTHARHTLYDAIIKALSWKLSSIYAKVKIQNIKNTLLCNPSASIWILFRAVFANTKLVQTNCRYSTLLFIFTFSSFLFSFRSAQLCVHFTIFASQIVLATSIWDRPTRCRRRTPLHTKCNLCVRKRERDVAQNPSTMRTGFGRGRGAPRSDTTAAKCIHQKFIFSQCIAFILWCAERMQHIEMT